MTLKRKILVGFCAVVLLGVLQSMISLLGLTRLRQQAGRVIEQHAPSSLAVQEARIVAARLARREFDRLQAGPDPRRLHLEFAQARQDFARIMSPLQGSAQAEAAAQVTTAVDEYGKSAVALAKAAEERAKTLRLLVVEAARLENAAATAEAAAALAKVRTAELEYRAAADPMSGAAAVDARMELRRRFDEAAGGLIAVMSSVGGGSAQAGGYQRHFAALFDQDGAITNLADDAKIRMGELELALEHLGRASEGDLRGDLKDLYGQLRDHVMWIAITAIAGVVLGGVIAYVLANEIIKPISRLRQAADRISLGELDMDLEEPGTNDEIGGLTRAFKRMVISIRALIQQEPP